MASIIKKSKLSHKCFRDLLKKFRRKKKRQLAAQIREEQRLKEQKIKESAPGYWEQEAERERNAKLWEEYLERERERKHKVWVLKEAEAQTEFLRKRQLQEKIKREEERKRILAEIEEKQLLENATLEKNKKEKKKKEEALQETLSSLPDVNEPWHNPLAPENYSIPSQEATVCDFYMKTGCCRFGERCSRGHPRPSTSCTLLIKGMYSHFSIGQAGRDDYDTDMALEYEDSETYQDFKNFYDDVLPEFKKFGRVVHFKVCCNHEPHLRGNVYVQFSQEREAVEALKAFNGRFYAGKQLTCEFCSVTNWNSAVCGLYHRKRCPKGDNCNYLHVFWNPDNEFCPPDRKYKFEKRGRKDRPYITSSSGSQRSYANNSHYSRSEQRDKYHHSSSHSDSHRRKHHYNSDSDDYDEDLLRTQRHKSSSKYSKSRNPHRDSHKKKSHHLRSRSSSSSSSSGEESEDRDSHHKKKKSKKSKKRKSRER